MSNIFPEGTKYITGVDPYTDTGTSKGGLYEQIEGKYIMQVPKTPKEVFKKEFVLSFGSLVKEKVGKPRYKKRYGQGTSKIIKKGNKHR